ncbi:MAG: FkbM family methyltransferase [Flavobacteriales bacterium]|nr:FkbM family methyltransferase [Flavobacteriales bacterium]
MIKTIVKKISGYNTLKSIREKKQFQRDLVEIYQRAKDHSFMKDLDDKERAHWRERIDLAKACPDSQKIDCLENTARLQGDFFIMHNGIKILPLSYYGYPMLQLLHENKGIHEPQEEYVFQEVLKGMKDNAVMIELGAYWSFYSMWFNKSIKGAKNYMIEPWELEHGIRNFEINELEGEFFKYYIADKPGVHHDGSNIISVDSFTQSQNIGFVDILHSDIQGNELLMLNGAKTLLENRKVGYVFVSTHSNELHKDCAAFLDQLGYIQLCSADIDQTYSYDGLLVYRNPDYEGIGPIQISQREK